MIRFEWWVQSRRAKGWVTLGSLAALPALLTLVIGLTQPSEAERIGDWGSVVTDSTGLALPLIALSAMLVFLLPLAVAIFAGEPLASEASWGSLRYLAIRPVARWRILGAKTAVAAGYCIVGVILAAAIGLLSGVIAFGWHPITVIDLQHTTPFHVAAATFSPLQATGRMVLTCAYILGLLSSTFAFSILLSTLTANAFGAVAGGIGLGLFSRALDNVPGLHALSAWLPVTDASSSLWTGFFTQPGQLPGMGRDLVVQGIYSVVFLGAAFSWFSRSDILS